jgi:hypothetical protein
MFSELNSYIPSGELALLEDRTELFCVFIFTLAIWSGKFSFSLPSLLCAAVLSISLQSIALGLLSTALILIGLRITFRLVDAIYRYYQKYKRIGKKVSSIFFWIRQILKSVRLAILALLFFGAMYVIVRRDPAIRKEVKRAKKNSWGFSYDTWMALKNLLMAYSVLSILKRAMDKVLFKVLNPIITVSTNMMIGGYRLSYSINGLDYQEQLDMASEVTLSGFPKQVRVKVSGCHISFSETFYARSTTRYGRWIKYVHQQSYDLTDIDGSVEFRVDTQVSFYDRVVDYLELHELSEKYPWLDSFWLPFVACLAIILPLIWWFVSDDDDDDNSPKKECERHRTSGASKIETTYHDDGSMEEKEITISHVKVELVDDCKHESDEVVKESPDPDLIRDGGSRRRALIDAKYGRDYDTDVLPASAFRSTYEVKREAALRGNTRFKKPSASSYPVRRGQIKCVCFPLNNRLITTAHELVDQTGDYSVYINGVWHDIPWASVLVRKDLDLCFLPKPAGVRGVKSFSCVPVKNVNYDCRYYAAILFQRDFGVLTSGETAHFVHPDDTGGELLCYYYMITEDGDCGSPIFFNINGAWRLIAIHCEGRKNHHNGGYLITDEIVELSKTIGTVKAANDEAALKKELSKIKPSGAIRQCRVVRNVNLKSGFYHDPFLQTVTPLQSDYVVPRMSKALMSESAKRFKGHSSAMILHQETINYTIAQYDRVHPGHTISDEDVISNLKKSSSPGLPYTLENIHSKKDVPDLEQKVADFRLSRPSYFVYSIFMKAELIKLVKILSGKIRLIMGDRIEQTVVTQRLTLPLYKACQLNRHILPIQIGISVYYGDFHVLWARLNRFSPLIWNSDFGSFETSVNRMYIDGDSEVMTAFMEEDDASEYEWLSSASANGFCVGAEEGFVCGDKVHSGDSRTSFMGSQFNWWYWLTAWVVLTGRPVHKFASYVLLFVYGDDSIAAFKPECVDFGFTPELIKRFWAASFIKSDGPDDFVTLEEADFLSFKCKKWRGKWVPYPKRISRMMMTATNHTSRDPVLIFEKLVELKKLCANHDFLWKMFSNLVERARGRVDYGDPRARPFWAMSNWSRNRCRVQFLPWEA